MPTFNRNEKTAILALTGLLVAGTIVSSIDYFWPSEIDDFEVRKQAISVPELKPPSEHTADTAYTPEPPAERINLNTATAKELTSLPQIGPKTAALILAYRQTHGAFKSLDELAEVKGIGIRTIEKLRDRVAIEMP